MGHRVYGDGDEVSFGCALLFLYYLKSQLGKSIEEIIQKEGRLLRRPTRT